MRTVFCQPGASVRWNRRKAKASEFVLELRSKSSTHSPLRVGTVKAALGHEGLSLRNRRESARRVGGVGTLYWFKLSL
jgi:hypothetical protein